MFFFPNGCFRNVKDRGWWRVSKIGLRVGNMARLRSRTTAGGGMRHITSSCTTYTHVYLATCGCQCMQSSRATPGSWSGGKRVGMITTNMLTTRQRRACVGYLAQLSHPQTGAAVWERDQNTEKWSGQGQTSRTGDAASAIYADEKIWTIDTVEHYKHFA